jgi:hypothetical protein
MPAESENQMNRETYAALKPLMQEIALQLTKKTKSEWTLRRAEADETMYFHIDSGNADIYITTAYNKDTHLNISGSTPRGTDRQYVRVYENIDTGNGMRWEEFKFSSINTAIAKGADKIANDIISRFLPDYLKVLRLTVERIQRDEQYAADKRTNLEACAATLHEVLRSDMRPIHGCDDVYEPVGSFHSNIGDTIRVEVKASSTDVDIDIDNLTVEQAKAVLQFIKRDLPLLVYDKRQVKEVTA